MPSNSSAASIVSSNADGTLLVVTSPAGVSGATVAVSAVALGGTATKPAAFTFSDQPTITAVSRYVIAATGGTKVTLTGTNFLGATKVTFGTKAAVGFTVVNSTTIVAYAPDGAAGLIVSVKVTTATGVATKSAAVVFGSAKPSISLVTPNTNAVAGITSVVITGANLYELTAVKFGSKVATILVPENGTQVTVRVPAGLAGGYTISIVSPDGTGTKANAIMVNSNSLCTPATLGAVTFGYKSTTLTAAMKLKLDGFAASVVNSKCTAVVLGRFTVTIKSTTPKAIVATQNLAVRRYVVVANYLKAKLALSGITLKTVTTKLSGQRTMTAASTTDLYSTNRRISVRAS